MADTEYDKVVDSIMRAYGASRKFSESMTDQKDRYIELTKQIEKLNAVVKRHNEWEDKARKKLGDKNKLLKETRDLLIKATKEQLEYGKSMDKLNKALELQAKNFGFVRYNLGALNTSAKNAIDVGVRYTTILGAQAISIDSVVKTLQAYRQGLFTLSRIQQTSGKGMGDLSAALRYVNKNTVMGKVDFMNFAGAMSTAYLGIAPTNKAMAELAGILQQRFGPNVDLINQKMTELLGIQNQFPPLYDKIMEAQDALNRGDMDRVKTLKASISGQMVAMGMTQQQMRTVFQMTTKQTNEQSKIIDVNQKIAENSKKAQDATVAMGEASAEAIKKAAEYTSKWLDLLNKFPGTAAAVMGAFAVGGAAGSIAGPVGGALLQTYLMKRMLSKAGVLGKTATAAKETGILTRVLTGSRSLGKIMPKGPSTTALRLLGKSPALNLLGKAALPLAAAQGAWNIGELGVHAYKWKQEKEAVRQGTSDIEEARHGSFRQFQDVKGGMEKKFGAEAVQKEFAKREPILKERTAGQEPYKVAKMYLKTLQEIEDELNRTAKIKPPPTGLELEKNLKDAKKETVKAEESLSKKRDEVNRKGKITKKDQEELVKLQKASDDAIQKEAQSVEELALNYGAVERTLIATLGFQKEINSLFEAQIGLGEKYSVANVDAIQRQAKAIKVMRATVSEAIVAKIPFLKASFEALAKEANIKVEPWSGDSQKDLERMFALFDKGKGVFEDMAKHSTLLKGDFGILAEAAKTWSMQVGLTGQYFDAIINKITKEMDINLKANATYMETLHTVREVRQAAMVGLGGDLAAMQDIINLNLQNIDEMKNGMARFNDEVRGTHKAFESLTDDEIDMVKNAKSNTAAKAAALKIMKDHGLTQEKNNEEYNTLVGLSRKHQEIQNMILKTNLEIYNLTKELREGYLDAFREMSTNAKEFEKIIGTQDMGYTQILKSIKDATGEYINTFTRGGEIAPGSKNIWARTSPVAQFQPSGVNIVPGNVFRAQTGEITDWKKYEDMAQRQNYGPAGTDQRSATLASSSLFQDYRTGAAREAQAKSKEEVVNMQAEGVFRGIKKANDADLIGNVVNPSVMSGGVKTATPPSDPNKRAEELSGFGISVAVPAVPTSYARGRYGVPEPSENQAEVFKTVADGIKETMEGYEKQNRTSIINEFKAAMINVTTGTAGESSFSVIEKVLNDAGIQPEDMKVFIDYSKDSNNQLKMLNATGEKQRKERTEQFRKSEKAQWDEIQSRRSANPKMPASAKKSRRAKTGTTGGINDKDSGETIPLSPPDAALQRARYQRVDEIYGFKSSKNEIKVTVAFKDPNSAQMLVASAELVDGATKYGAMV